MPSMLAHLPQQLHGEHPQHGIAPLPLRIVPPPMAIAAKARVHLQLLVTLTVLALCLSLALLFSQCRQSCKSVSCSGLQSACCGGPLVQVVWIWTLITSMAECDIGLICLLHRPDEARHSVETPFRIRLCRLRTQQLEPHVSSDNLCFNCHAASIKLARLADTQSQVELECDPMYVYTVVTLRFKLYMLRPDRTCARRRCCSMHCARSDRGHRVAQALAKSPGTKGTSQK